MLAQVREALHAADLRPDDGRDPRSLSDPETEELLLLISTRVRNVIAASSAAGLPLADFYASLGVAIHALAATAAAGSTG